MNSAHITNCCTRTHTATLVFVCRSAPAYTKTLSAVCAGEQGVRQKIMKRDYSVEEMKNRAIKRVAEVIYGQWEEGRGVHSRIFEVLVPDGFVINGKSIKGGTYREHIVPCSLIRNHANKMYNDQATITEVANMIDKHLRIVMISHEEAKYIDNDLGLKEVMPNGWEFGEGDPLARLYVGGVVLA